MDAQLMLLIASLVGLILLTSLVVGLVTSHRRRARLRLNRRVNATITHIQVEAPRSVVGGRSQQSGQTHRAGTTITFAAPIFTVLLDIVLESRSQ